MPDFICSFSIIYTLLSVSFFKVNAGVSAGSVTGQNSPSNAQICKTNGPCVPYGGELGPETSPPPPTTTTVQICKTNGPCVPYGGELGPETSPPPRQGANSTVMTNSSSNVPSRTDIVPIPNPSEAPQPSRSGTDIEANKPDSNNPPKIHRKNLAPVIAGPTAGGLVIIFLLIGKFLIVLRRTKVQEDYVKQVPGTPLRFSYKELRNATENFKERLGGGGFGSVFKGVLADGTNIAVKRLDKVSQGMKEFIAEVETIGGVHHFNLVRLIGFCAEKSSRLLVYEYMSNGSLDNWIFYRDQRPCLDWQTRKKIILDIAKGLAYLHEECRQRIIHLDIKPQNILLDENFNAKVSDFGLSKLMDRDESQVQTNMRGTPGYIAPEWRQLRITLKVDIYSFGIVLLETVCARRNLDKSRSESSMHLLRLLQQKAEEDRLIDIVDKFDEDMPSHREEVERMIRIGAWCLQDDHTKRPLMSTVVMALEGVMEADPNINYKFAHAMASSSVVNGHVPSSAPPESVLSGPR